MIRSLNENFTSKDKANVLSALYDYIELVDMKHWDNPFDREEFNQYKRNVISINKLRNQWGKADLSVPTEENYTIEED